MSLFKRLFSKRKDLFNRSDLIIKSAFVVGGIEYFEIENILNLPVHRGQGAANIYRQLAMHVDDEFLKGHVTAMDNLFNGKKIGLDEIAKMKNLNSQLSERLYKVIDTDLVYKLASVVFFDESESPYDYDEAHAKKKIAYWKKHSNINDFFLQEPLLRLVPFLRQREINFQNYSELIQKLKQIQWDEVYALLTESQREIFNVNRDSFAPVMQPESVN